MKSVQQRKDEVLEQLRTMDRARRGQLSEQYYTRQTAGGRTVRTGPYYVWQRWVKGKKVSARIRPEDIDEVQADLQRGRAVQEILDAYFSLMEEAASAQKLDRKSELSRASTPRKARRSTSTP